jgi:hypothetical protein
MRELFLAAGQLTLHRLDVSVAVAAADVPNLVRTPTHHSPHANSLARLAVFLLALATAAPKVRGNGAVISTFQSDILISWLPISSMYEVPLALDTDQWRRHRMVHRDMVPLVAAALAKR